MEKTPTPRDVRDRKIIEALGLNWLITGRIAVSDEGVSWSHIAVMAPGWMDQMPHHTSWAVSHAEPRWSSLYLTRTYQDMPHSVRRTIERAELDFRRAMGEPIPKTLQEAVEDFRAALMGDLVIPAAYRLAGLLSRIQGWFRG